MLENDENINYIENTENFMYTGIPEDEGLPGHPGHAYDLPSNGGNQGKRDLQVGLVLQGYRMNVMTHGLEKRLPLLPLGVDVQSAYITLAAGSNRVTVVLRNNTRDWLEIRKGTP